MKVSVADIAVEVAGLGDPFEEQMQARYAAFPGGEPEMLITMADADVPRCIIQRDAAPGAQIWRDKLGHFHVMSKDRPFEAVLDLEQGLGALNCGRDVRCFDRFLRVLYSVLLATRGDFLIEATRVGTDGLEYLIADESGVSRRIVAHNGVPERLRDDLIAVRRREGQLIAQATPFLGDNRIPEFEGEGPLGGLFLVRRAEPGEDAHIESLSPQRALLEVLGATYFFGPEECASAVVRNVVKVLEQCDVGEFCWVPGSDVAESFADALAAWRGVAANETGS